MYFVRNFAISVCSDESFFCLNERFRTQSKRVRTRSLWGEKRKFKVQKYKDRWPM